MPQFTQQPQPTDAWNADDFGGTPNFGGASLEPQYQQYEDDLDIDAELDALLSPDEPLDLSAPQQQNISSNANEFRLLIEEQRAQRELDRQRLDLDRQRQQSVYDQQRTEAEAKVRRAEIESRVQRFAPQIAERHISPEMAQTYQGADPYIQSVVEKAIKAQWETSYAPAFMHYEEQLDALRSRPTAPSSLSVDDRVALMRPEVDTLIKEQAFQAFLAEPVEGTGMTRKELLNVAYERGNANAVVQHLDAYKSRRDQARPSRSVAPQSGVHSAPTGRPKQQGRNVPYSRLQEAQTKFRQGLISREKLFAVESRFEDLAAQGLVDYNK